MKLLLSISLFTFCGVLLAQNEKGFVRHTTQQAYLHENVSHYQYLLADEVILRKCASDTCPVIDQLAIGTRFINLERSETEATVNGITSNWYKIDVSGRKGWIWGGFIARYAFGSMADPQVKFFAGLGEVIRDEEGRIIETNYQLRAVKNHKQLDKAQIPGSLDFNYINNAGTKGIPKVDDIIVVHIPCRGGCGCTTGDLVYFWNGDKIVHVADLLGMADAEFSEGKTFIYPSDMEGEEGLIIQLEEGVDEEYRKEISYDKHEYKRYIKKKYFRWTGEELVPADRDSSAEEYKFVSQY